VLPANVSRSGSLHAFNKATGKSSKLTTSFAFSSLSAQASGSAALEQTVMTQNPACGEQRVTRSDGGMLTQRDQNRRQKVFNKGDLRWFRGTYYFEIPPIYSVS